MLNEHTVGSLQLSHNSVDLSHLICQLVFQWPSCLANSGPNLSPHTIRDQARTEVLLDWLETTVTLYNLITSMSEFLKGYLLCLLNSS